jgi:hypothetical protein
VAETTMARIDKSCGRCKELKKSAIQLKGASNCETRHLSAQQAEHLGEQLGQTWRRFQ